MNLPERLLPDIVFPAYSYVPGRWPHPYSDAGGHGFRVADAVPELSRGWQACRPYLLGLDLFNFGYYWEAHEAWESLWHAAGRKGALADFFKGLIQLAVAGVKIREGRGDGARAHAWRAVELFGGLGPEPVVWGLDRAQLLGHANSVAAQSSRSTSGEPVERVFEWGLVPSREAEERIPQERCPGP